MKYLRIKVSTKDFKPLLRSHSAQAATMVLKPGQSSSEEVENEHPLSEQWLFVISGNGTARVGKRTVRLTMHTLLLIEKGEGHRITNSGTRLLVTLNFYGPPAYSKSGRVLSRISGRV